MRKDSPKEIIASGNLVEQNSKILMVQEKRPDFHGKWNIPIGRKEPEEDIVSCAKREGKEETGFELKPLYLIGEYRFNLPSGDAVIGFIFRSEIIGGQLTVPDDMMDVKFFSFEGIEELNKKSLIAPYIKDVIRDDRAGKKIPINEIGL